jgi:phospholipase/carboxylesterase
LPDPEPGLGSPAVPIELPHLIREPAAEPEGALILLHGRAVDETDLFPLLDELDPERKLFGMTPGGPLTGIPPGGRHWYRVEQVGHPDEETFVATLKTVCGFIDATLMERGVPWEKTVIGGFSMGCGVSYAVALGTGRPRAAGILGMSGFLPMVRGWRIDIGAKRGMPVYITHGAYDPVIPVDFGRRARDVLEEGGLHVTYRETRVQHSIAPELLPEMREWVASAISGEPQAGPSPV